MVISDASTPPLPGEFLDSVNLPPREFLDRIHSALCVLTLPHPHHVAPSSAPVPAAIASSEYVLGGKDASLQPFSNSIVAPTEF